MPGHLDVDYFRPLSSVVALDVEAVSVAGAASAHNTDHYLAIRLGRTQETLRSSLAAADLPPRFEEHAYALLVADGLGEAASGARASRVALSALAHLAIRYGHWNVRIDGDTVATVLEQGEFLWRRAHNAVARAASADVRLNDMAASVTAMYVAGVDLFFAHSGHSKGYLFRDDTLIPLTSDHTLVQLYADGAIVSPDAELRTDATHQVVNALGGTRDPDVDLEHVTLADGDRLLLCTNGLTDAVTDDAIAGVLALRRRPADDCRRLADLAAAGRAADDVTVMVADYRLRA